MRVTEKWREEIEKGVMPERVVKTFDPKSVEVSTDPSPDVRKASFVVSTADVDRDEDVIEQGGWELGPYIKAGAPVLWAHQNTQPPIARAESIGVQGGRLKAVTVFPEKGIYPFADTIFGLVKGGFIKGTSVGFHPIEAEQRQGAKKGVRFKRQELMEFSILPIPSNREALLEAKSAGHDIREVVKWAEALLDQASESGLWIPRYQIEKALKTILPLQVAVPAVPPSRQDVALEGHATAGAALSEDEAKGVLDAIKDLREEADMDVVQKVADELFGEIKAVSPEVLKRIKMEDGKHCVYSEDYSKKLGCHKTHAEAVNQLQAIEASKHSRGKDIEADVKKWIETDPWIDVARLAEACPDCATKAKSLGITRIRVKAMSEQALAGLCAKFGEGAGFRTRCMESSIGEQAGFESEAAFCNWLKIQCHGSATAGEEKAAPPWMQGKDKPPAAPPAAPAPPQDQTAQTPQPPQGDGKTPEAGDAGKKQGGDPTEQDKTLAPILDQLAQSLLAEIEPLKQGGDPTQIATALKAALEKFAASFMQSYAGAPAPTAQAPAAAPPPAAKQPPVPPPPPPPMKGDVADIVKLFEGLTEDELRGMIETATKTSIADARKHLSGRLPD